MDAKQRAAAICKEARRQAESNGNNNGGYMVTLQERDELQAAVEMLCAEAQLLKGEQPLKMHEDACVSVSVDFEGVTFISEHDNDGDPVRLSIDAKSGAVDIGFMLTDLVLSGVDRAARKQIRRERMAA